MLLSAMESPELKRKKTMQQIMDKILRIFFTVLILILIYFENKRTESIIGILINNFRYFLNF